MAGVPTDQVGAERGPGLLCLGIIRRLCVLFGSFVEVVHLDSFLCFLVAFVCFLCLAFQPSDNGVLG